VEEAMKINKRCSLALLLLLPLLVVAITRGDAETELKWTVFGNVPALANDGSIIRIGGTGSFVVDEPNNVTGGGTWATLDSSGTTPTSGTFQVTSLVEFDPAPGTVPGAPKLRAGLAFLQITYSDGTRGILVVGCRLNGTPVSVAEGFTASKGNIDYWDGFKGLAVFSVP